MTLTSTTCDWYVPQGGTFNVYETSNATALCYVNATQSGFSTDVDITGTVTVGGDSAAMLPACSSAQASLTEQERSPATWGAWGTVSAGPALVSITLPSTLHTPQPII